MRPIPAVAIAALLLTAGCAGFGLGSGPTPATNTSATETAAPVPDTTPSPTVEGGDMTVKPARIGTCTGDSVADIPGVRNGTIHSLDRLETANREVLLNRDGAAISERVTRRTNVSTTEISEPTETTTTRVASSDRWITRKMSFTMSDNATAKYQYASSLYFDEDGGLFRDGFDNESYEYRTFAPDAMPAPITPDPGTLGQFYRAANFTHEGTVKRDGERLYLFTAGDDPERLAFPVTEQRQHMRLLVTQCGMIRHLSLGLTAIDSERSVQVRFRYNYTVDQVGNVSVATPAWVTDYRSDNETAAVGRQW